MLKIKVKWYAFQTLKKTTECLKSPKKKSVTPKPLIIRNGFSDERNKHKTMDSDGRSNKNDGGTDIRRSSIRDYIPIQDNNFPRFSDRRRLRHDDHASVRSDDDSRKGNHSNDGRTIRWHPDQLL